MSKRNTPAGRKMPSHLLKSLIVLGIGGGLANAQAVIAPTSAAWSKPDQRPQVDFSNSSRLDLLRRGNRIYLSLQDAIALAIENNLDIEAARYLPKIAMADQLRASAGEFIRSTPTIVVAGPDSASGILSTSGPLASIANSSGSQFGLAPIPAVAASGTSLPQLDPFIFATGSFGHQSFPQTNSILTGTNSLNTNSQEWNFGIQKSFLTGGTVSLSWLNTRLDQNAPYNNINPAILATTAIDFRQPLLRGFGRSLNSRVIEIARRNRTGSDLTFRAQLTATVYSVINLYYDLVSFHDQLRVKRSALEISEKLFEANKREAAIGSLAAADLDRSQAEVFAGEQEIAAGETQVLQQEMLLKNVLTRTGIDSLDFAEATIILLDRFSPPENEQAESSADLISRALQVRPELLESLLQMENKQLSIKGSRDALKPSLDFTASLRNNALAGSLNQASPTLNPASGVNSYLIGDYGSVIRQLLDRDFPDYIFGFSLNVPLGNRAARADLARDEADLRLLQIAHQKLRNALKLAVLNTQVAVVKAREAYLASRKTREAAERNYNTELRKKSLGASTTLDVILASRDLTIRQLAEVTSLNTYARAKNGLSTLAGDLLREHNVDMEEAYSGTVKQGPSTLPTTGKTESSQTMFP